MPFGDGYFIDSAGQPVTRTVYDYLRDHLGYRIQLDQAQFGTNAGASLPVKLSLTNVGFSASHTPRPTQLVLLSATGEVVRRGADWTRWQGARATENGGTASHQHSRFRPPST
ncbi:DUF4832 domain-containing protein [Micromonospora sp. LZ34]